MASRTLAIYRKDASGDSYYDTFSGINPALNDTNIGVFVTATSTLADGELVKTVVTDKKELYPSAQEGE